MPGAGNGGRAEAVEAKGETDMTMTTKAATRTIVNYTQAQIIIWNPDSYSPQLVAAAVAYILGSMRASREDIDQACLLVA